jgi:mannitol-specific phosphotransferase system IIBC component
MDNSTRAGTAGGTFLAFIANLSKDDILKTTVLTMIGAVVSFVVSIVLQFIVGRFKKERRNRTPG